MRLGGHCWFLDKNGYVQRQLGRRGEPLRKLYLHREIMGLPPSGAQSADEPVVDHINGDPLDNRRSNLRVVTRAQNAQNRRARGGTSRHRGVALIPATGRWLAQAGLHGSLHYIGTFATEAAAASAARRWRSDHMPFSVER